MSNNAEYDSDTGILGSIGNKTVSSSVTTKRPASSRRKMASVRKSIHSSRDGGSDVSCVSSILEKLSLTHSGASGVASLGFCDKKLEKRKAKHRAYKKPSAVAANSHRSTSMTKQHHEVNTEMRTSSSYSDEDSDVYSSDSDHETTTRPSSSAMSSLALCHSDSKDTDSSATVAFFHQHDIDPIEDLTSPNTPASVPSTPRLYDQNITSNFGVVQSGGDDFLPMPPQTRMHSMSNNRVPVKKGKWVLGEQIGAGSFGVVHMGLNCRSGALMAVKTVNIVNFSHKNDIDDFQREIDVMRVLYHDNIVRYLGAEVNEEAGLLYIFQEWVPGKCRAQ